MSDRRRLLIGLVADAAAGESDRIDAAMELEGFPGRESVDALVDVAKSVRSPILLVEVAGESLGGMWAVFGSVDVEVFRELRAQARYELVAALKGKAPYLLGGLDSD